MFRLNKLKSEKSRHRIDFNLSNFQVFQNKYSSCCSCCFFNMARVHLYIAKALLLCLIFHSSGATSAPITVINRCSYKIWPAIVSRATSPQPSITGFVLELEPNESSKPFLLPSSWSSGWLWGRTRCNTNPTGNFTCLTGDCGTGKIKCDGSGPSAQTTLVELTRVPSGKDIASVSPINGFNLLEADEQKVTEIRRGTRKVFSLIIVGIAVGSRAGAFEEL